MNLEIDQDGCACTASLRWFSPRKQGFETADAGFREMTGEVEQMNPRSLSRRGCRLFKKQRRCIPSDLCMVGFSITTTGPAQYISGMGFISRDYSAVRLGYTAPGNDIFLEVTAIRGLILAIDPRRIRALQVVGSIA